LLERLYPLAKTRQDKPLLAAVLKQLFALPEQATALPLLQKLADDVADPQQRLLQHPAVLLHLLQRLIKAGDSPRALAPWRRLCQVTPVPPQLPGLTLQLAKQLGQRQDLRSVGELGQYLRRAFPEAEQTRQLALYQQHLAR
jgi:Tfp pilus assembly protein PilF